MATAPLLSVVVPCYRARPTIERCLAALTRECRSLPAEIVVVDSGDDGLADLVRARFPDVVMVSLPERALPGRARNEGVRIARAAHLAFVDADCVVQAGWGERARLVVAADVSFSGGAVLPGRPLSLRGLVGFFTEFAQFLPGAPRAGVAAPSCNLVVERALFASAGGFPEDMRSGEDLVFVARCRELRGPLALSFDDERAVTHAAHASWGELVGHLVDVGRGSAEARARAPSLPGAPLARRPPLGPVVVGVRFLRILQHAARARPLTWLALALAVSPLVLACLCAWAVGFAAPAASSRRGG